MLDVSWDIDAPPIVPDEWDKPPDDSAEWDVPPPIDPDADSVDDDNIDWDSFTPEQSANEFTACLMEAYLENRPVSARRVCTLCFWAGKSG